MTKDKKELDKEAIDFLQRQNDGAGLPMGLYHNVHINGANFQVEITTPCHCMNIVDCVHFTELLALFITDEEVRATSKMNIKKMLEQPGESGE